jgi:N-acetylglucosamine-6-phosphate deacetylase
MRRILRMDLSGIRGANMPGFHLEGPYLSPDALGAISAESIKLPDPADFAEFDNVKLITVAPELAGAIDYIRTTSARVSIGHTAADYATAMAAIEAGASCVTHTFNAMTPLHHREPGVLGAAIDGDIWVQVISDGVHLHPSVVKMLYRTFGKKMILISDAVSGTGLPDGVYMRQGKYPRRIVDGTIRTSTGRLAGSASDLYRDVCKAIEFGIPREDAFYMASTAPAQYMGLNKGRIETGYDADFIAIDAENNIHTVVIGGEIFTA